MDHNSMAPETLCSHMETRLLPPDNYALATPIYQSVKFAVEDFDELKRIFRNERTGYFYSRHGNPTVAQLENLLAELQYNWSLWLDIKLIVLTIWVMLTGRGAY